MSVVLLLLLVAVVVGVGVVAAGHGDGLPDAPPDRAPVVLPVGPLRPTDLSGLRLSTGVRGYRMSEVDDVLDRLAGELAWRDTRIAALQGELRQCEQRAGETTGGSNPPQPSDG